jgi:hypothetical protein
MSGGKQNIENNLDQSKDGNFNMSKEKKNIN